MPLVGVIVPPVGCVTVNVYCGFAGVAGVIVYTALVTELEVQPLFTAIARIVSLALTVRAPAYSVDELVGIVPSVV